MEKQRRLPRRELPNIRAQFVRMLDAELPAKSIMVALKLSRSTFFEWKRLYRERGVKGLEVRPIPGGTPKLTDQQTNQLLRWIIGRDPRQFQFDFALWTRKIVGDLIRRMFDVEMTPQGIGKLLHRIGLSPQRPTYRAYQQDPEGSPRGYHLGPGGTDPGGGGHRGTFLSQHDLRGFSGRGFDVRRVLRRVQRYRLRGVSEEAHA
jgi:transposase